jgi:hypothetical protein
MQHSYREQDLPPAAIESVQRQYRVSQNGSHHHFSQDLKAMSYTSRWLASQTRRYL